MEIIYLFDPLCGWCYGFGPQMLAFAKAHPAFSYTVLSGGMVTGERVGPLSQIAPYIREGVRRVEELSGVAFGPDFLADLHGAGNSHMDSTSPTKAFIILKEFVPTQAVAVAHAVQAVFYAHGLDLNAAASYRGLCDDFGVDFEAFREKFESVAYQLAAKDEFKEAARYGVSGYPTVVVRFGQQYYMLGHGFAKSEQLTSTLERIREQEQV